MTSRYEEVKVWIQAGRFPFYSTPGPVANLALYRLDEDNAGIRNYTSKLLLRLNFESKVNNQFDRK